MTKNRGVRRLISDEFADTVEEFRERVGGDAVLQDELQNDLNIQTLEETRKTEQRLRRIAGEKTYEVYDSSKEREEVIERVE